MNIAIRNGHLLDAAAGIDEERKLYLTRGRITDTRPAKIDMEIDAKGAYVFPGFIDSHVHVFYGGSQSAVRPDLLLSTGVTTAVDGGTAGPGNFEAFYESVIARSKIRMKACVGVSPVGQTWYGVEENYDPRVMESNREYFRRLKEKYPSVIAGLKIKYSRELVGDYGMDSLKKAIELAKDANLPLVTHVTNMPDEASVVAGALRRGDVFCHMYQGIGNTILDQRGRVAEGIKQARERGVVFDACNGKSNFCFEVAKKALKEGFIPDILSTDHTTLTLFQDYFAKTLPDLMSKYLALGLDLKTVLSMVTKKPAEFLGMSGQIGTLAEGAYADIAVCRLEKREVLFKDVQGEVLKGDTLIIPEWVISDGELVYRRAGI